MIKHNSHYSRGQNEHSTQSGLDIPNQEELNTTAQPQGGANLYKVTEEKARYARAYSVDSEQAQAQLRPRYAKKDYYHDALKILKVLMDNLDNLDEIKSYVYFFLQNIKT